MSEHEHGHVEWHKSDREIEEWLTQQLERFRACSQCGAIVARDEMEQHRAGHEQQGGDCR